MAKKKTTEIVEYFVANLSNSAGLGLLETSSICSRSNKIFFEFCIKFSASSEFKNITKLSTNLKFSTVFVDNDDDVSSLFGLIISSMASKI